ncbi:MAG: hypothetical protein H6657_11315 [Ardenticatenaceae bacterium]|nr:hypothetical protein [Ardenticatenaceae bacterium]
MSETTMDVYLEIGKKKLFAGAVDWPGWCCGGKDEATALAALLAAAPRYAALLQNTSLTFEVPTSADAFHIVERVPGTNTTDFGAPDALITRDHAPFSAEDLAEAQSLLAAYWAGFDAAVETAVGHELRKGPRGGGRELEGIVEHVLESSASYLRVLGWKFPKVKDESPAQRMARLREEIGNGLAAATAGELDEEGPRGGKRWPPRYFVRRLGWHIIDHIWEIEDRMP